MSDQMRTTVKGKSNVVKNESKNKKAGVEMGGTQNG